MLGIDIVDIRRIRRIYNKYKEKFVDRILSCKESFKDIKDIAKAFSVKESIAKALGTGLRGKVNFKNIYLLKDKLGKPYIEFAENLKEELPNIHIEISISHERNYLISIAMIQYSNSYNHNK